MGNFDKESQNDSKGVRQAQKRPDLDSAGPIAPIQTIYLAKSGNFDL